MGKLLRRKNTPRAGSAEVVRMSTRDQTEAHGGEHLQKRGTTDHCVWCGAKFEPRKTGGKPQTCCCRSHTRAFWRALRWWGSEQFEAGKVSAQQLHEILQRRSENRSKNRTGSAPQ
jgi:hypothetical protein